MPTKFLDAAMLQIGRLLGQSRRKEPEITQQWMDVQNAAGVKPTERLVELLAWDLQNNGVNLADVRTGSKVQQIDDAFQEAELGAKVRGLVKALNDELLQKEQQHRMELDNLMQENSNLRRKLYQLEVDIQQLQTVQPVQVVPHLQTFHVPEVPQVIKSPEPAEPTEKKRRKR